MSATKKSEGFTAEEKAAMRARAKELKAAADGETAVREAVEPLEPRADALEGIGHERASADAADLLGRDEFRLLEQPDVLLHPGQRHAERLGELADRRAARAEPLEHGAARGVGEGGEGEVDG